MPNIQLTNTDQALINSKFISLVSPNGNNILESVLNQLSSTNPDAYNQVVTNEYSDFSTGTLYLKGKAFLLEQLILVIKEKFKKVMLAPSSGATPTNILEIVQTDEWGTISNWFINSLRSEALELLVTFKFVEREATQNPVASQIQAQALEIDERNVTRNALDMLLRAQQPDGAIFNVTMDTNGDVLITEPVRVRYDVLNPIEEVTAPPQKIEEAKLTPDFEKKEDIPSEKPSKQKEMELAMARINKKLKDATGKDLAVSKVETKKEEKTPVENRTQFLEFKRAAGYNSDISQYKHLYDLSKALYPSNKEVSSSEVAKLMAVAVRKCLDGSGFTIMDTSSYKSAEDQFSLLKVSPRNFSANIDRWNPESGVSGDVQLSQTPDGELDISLNVTLGTGTGNRRFKGIVETAIKTLVTSYYKAIRSEETVLSTILASAIGTKEQVDSCIQLLLKILKPSSKINDDGFVEDSMDWIKENTTVTQEAHLAIMTKHVNECILCPFGNIEALLDHTKIPTALGISEHAQHTEYTSGIFKDLSESVRASVLYISESICTAILRRCLPAVSMLYRKIADTLAFKAVHQLTTGNSAVKAVNLVHGISPNGPHIVIDISTQKVLAKTAITVSSIIATAETTEDVKKVLIDTAISRTKDTIAVLTKESLSAVLTEKYKKYYLVTDQERLQCVGMATPLLTKEERELIEDQYCRAVNTISEKGYYVITFRKPLTQKELKESTSLLTGYSTYKMDPLSEHALRNRWSRPNFDRTQNAAISTDITTAINSENVLALKGELSKNGTYADSNKSYKKLNFSIDYDRVCSHRLFGGEIRNTPQNVNKLRDLKVSFPIVTDFTWDGYYSLPIINRRSGIRLNFEGTRTGTTNYLHEHGFLVNPSGVTNLVSRLGESIDINSTTGEFDLKSLVSLMEGSGWISLFKPSNLGGGNRVILPNLELENVQRALALKKVKSQPKKNNEHPEFDWHDTERSVEYAVELINRVQRGAREVQTNVNTAVTIGMITPDISRTMSFMFSFYQPTKGQYLQFLYRNLLAARKIESFTDKKSEEKSSEISETSVKVMTPARPTCVNYIPKEYTDKVKSKRKVELEKSIERSLDMLRRAKSDYSRLFREETSLMRQRKHDLIKIGSVGSGLLSEEEQISSLIEKGIILGMRVINNSIKIRIPEISIWSETPLIHHIGEMVAMVENFDTHPIFKFQNLSYPFKMDPGVENPTANRYGVDYRIQDHPHSRSGTACLGNVSGMLNSAISNRDIIGTVMLLKSYLGTVNLNDGYGATICRWWPAILPTIRNIIRYDVVGSLDPTRHVLIRNTGSLARVRVIAQKEFNEEFDRAVVELERDPSPISDFEIDECKDSVVTNIPSVCHYYSRASMDTLLNQKVVSNPDKVRIRKAIDELNNMIKSGDLFKANNKKVSGPESVTLVKNIAEREA